MIEELKIVADIMDGVTEGAITGVISFFIFMVVQSIIEYGSWVLVFFLGFKFIGKLSVSKNLFIDGLKIETAVADEFKYRAHVTEEKMNELYKAMNLYSSNTDHFHKEHIDSLIKVLKDGNHEKDNS